MPGKPGPPATVVDGHEHLGAEAYLDLLHVQGDLPSSAPLRRSVGGSLPRAIEPGTARDDRRRALAEKAVRHQLQGEMRAASHLFERLARQLGNVDPGRRRGLMLE
jgi:hypothetical protein